jgi:acyl-CoA dehydrogenase
VRETAAAVATVAREHAARVDAEGVFPAATLDAMRAAGLLGAMVPCELGGGGLPPSQVALIAAELGAGCASSGMIFAMHQIQVACLIGHAASAPWHREFLARVASAGLLLASVTSEAGVGGSLRTSRCALDTAEHGQLRISKSATAISYGAHADAFLLTARRGPGAPESDQVLIVAERRQCEFEPRGRWDALGMRGTRTEPFTVHAAIAPEQVMPAPFGDIAAASMVPASHLFWASLWLGIAADAVGRARAFLRDGARQGRPLPAGAGRLAGAVAGLQALQARTRALLATYDTRVVLAAAREPAVQPPSAEMAELNGLKIAVSEGAVEAARQALLVLGFVGYQNNSSYSVARHLRDLLSAPLMVSNDAIRDVTARMLLSRSPTLGLGQV